MSQSGSSQHRAQLVREMAKDMNKTRNSSASSQHSRVVPSISDFDPENEAFSSSRELDIPHILRNQSHHEPYDIPQNLPQLRASAEKYRHRFPHRRASLKSDNSYAKSDEFCIDTSALGRAFPDFTQGSDDSKTDISGWLEKHRGIKRGSGDAIANLKRTKEYSSNVETGLDKDTADLSIPLIESPGGRQYQVMYTPPLRQRQTSKKIDDASPTSMRRDAQLRRASGLQNQSNDPSPPPLKMKDSGSEGSRKASGEARRTLASMHARVRDENDRSLVGEERPPTIDLTARNTRFANTTGQQVTATAQQHAHIEGLPTRFSSAQTLLGSVAPKNKRNTQYAPSSAQATQQSFGQSTLPNISELISGIYQDGTPVFSLDGKPRQSRFVRVLQHNMHTNGANIPVDDVDLAIDEQAIFLNIKLLEDKVAILERQNAEAEVTIDELRAKNRVVEGQNAIRQRAARSDSALGTTDSDDGNDTGVGQRRLMIEKNRLQSSVHALEAQVDATTRKAATAETILKNITQERDSAVSQLGVAYFTIEQLKGDNEALREENNDLKTRIGQLTVNHESETREKNSLKARIGQLTTNCESETQKNNDLRARISQITTGYESETQKNNDLRARINQITTSYESETQKWTAKEEAMQRKLQEVKTMVAKFNPPSLGPGSKSASAAHFQAPTEDQGLDEGEANASTHKEVDTLFDFSGTPRAAKDMSKHVQQATQLEMETTQESHHAASEISKGKGKAQGKESLRAPSNQDDGTSMDLTYLSYVHTKDIADLRKTLEQERLERKQRQQCKRQPSKGDNTFTEKASAELQSQHSQQVLPRKSSMKELTTGSLPQETTEKSIHTEPREHNRRHSETSLLSIRSRRRGLDAENMTSAFIVPDITIRNPVAITEEIPAVTKEGQKVLEGLANHNGQNCTVCTRFVKRGEDHHHALAVKETIKIPKPVPVSERMPKTSDNEDDHTIRPSQPPGLALATVMKGLEDELAHLKIQFNKYQTLYNGHNPALSKRSRKSVQQKMEGLLRAIDVKADQIYALYDVLEGQKQEGHEISDEEVEITLQSIGVDVATLQLRGGEIQKQAEKPKPKPRIESHPWDLESEGESEGLPWEGLDSTIETTKSGVSMASRRRSSAT